MHEKLKNFLNDVKNKQTLEKYRAIKNLTDEEKIYNSGNMLCILDLLKNNNDISFMEANVKIDRNVISILSYNKSNLTYLMNICGDNQSYNKYINKLKICLCDFFYDDLSDIIMLYCYSSYQLFIEDKLLYEKTIYKLPCICDEILVHNFCHKYYYRLNSDFENIYLKVKDIFVSTKIIKQYNKRFIEYVDYLLT
jgi:hypothetical protein